MILFDHLFSVPFHYTRSVTRILSNPGNIIFPSTSLYVPGKPMAHVRYAIVLVPIVMACGCTPTDPPASSTSDEVSVTEGASDPIQSEVKDEAFKELGLQLQSDDPEERKTAIKELKRDYGHVAVPLFIAALDDTDLDVRIALIQVLRDIRDDRAVEPLCELLKTEPTEEFMVSNITTALGSIGSSSALPVLIKTLKSEDAFTRYDAAFALGQIGDPEAIPALEKLLSDDTMPKRNSKSTIYSVGEQAQRAIDMIRKK